MHMFVVFLNLLCTSPTSTVLLEYTKLQLGCVDLLVLLACTYAVIYGK